MREAAEAVGGERRGSMLVFVDADGLRHAVRASAVLAASDVDDSRDATLLQLPGGRFVVVRLCLDEVLGWLSASPPASGAFDGPEARLLRQQVAESRGVLEAIVACLADSGVVSAGGLAAIRDGCAASLRAAVGGAEGGVDLFSWFAGAAGRHGH